MGMPQQGSSGNPNEERDVKKSDDEEKQNLETRGEDTKPGAETDREPDREEFTTRRLRHVPGGTWLHNVRAFINKRAPIGFRGCKGEVREHMTSLVDKTDQVGESHKQLLHVSTCDALGVIPTSHSPPTPLPGESQTMLYGITLT
ncbi:hypothetical protein NDU88_001970 [Pleurodeles waltl]|uniref:Uncharacterized protein n=1 Tax=Pleurodeles waltl TaxID=8319 RepID=A0AAV7M140_PLEWA|nr:hypothetical protein NDU88_001970 [Pleurodeles waltl]